VAPPRCWGAFGIQSVSGDQVRVDLQAGQRRVRLAILAALCVWCVSGACVGRVVCIPGRAASAFPPLHLTHDRPRPRPSLHSVLCPRRLLSFLVFSILPFVHFLIILILIVSSSPIRHPFIYPVSPLSICHSSLRLRRLILFHTLSLLSSLLLSFSHSSFSPPLHSPFLVASFLLRSCPPAFPLPPFLSILAHMKIDSGYWRDWEVWIQDEAGNRLRK